MTERSAGTKKTMGCLSGRMPRLAAVVVLLSSASAAAQIPPPASTNSAAVEIIVSAKQACTPTGLTVRRDEVLTLNTTGEFRLSADPVDVATAAGAKSGRYAPNSPLPRNFAGALFGRVSNGLPFPIGSVSTITVPNAGPLSLCINDDSFEDNSGELRVEITRAIPRPIARAASRR